MGVRGLASLNALLLALVFAAAPAVRAQALPELDDLLRHVGDRIAAFYERATSVVCSETSTVQGIDSAFSPQGFARTVESQLHLEPAGGSGAGEAALVRNVVKVNGRAPRDGDKKDRNGCTDPNPLTPEPLAFLLPAHRAEYRFKLAGTAKDRNRSAIIIEFASVTRRSTPELIEDPGGHEDCFDWTGHIAARGRIWVDAVTHDVLRVDRGLVGPVDVKVSPSTQRRHHLPPFVALVRDDLTVRYVSVPFADPAEELLLPESIESLTIVSGGLQSTRRSQAFSGYRRFVTGGRVLE